VKQAITEHDLTTALVQLERSGDRLGVVLVRMNLATEKQIAQALAVQLGFPYTNLAEHPPDPVAVALIPKAVSLKRACIAVSLEKRLLTVARSDPLLFSLVQDLEFQTGYRIKQVVATRIIEAIQTGYPDQALTGATPSRSDLASSPAAAGSVGTPGSEPSSETGSAPARNFRRWQRAPNPCLGTRAQPFWGGLWRGTDIETVAGSDQKENGRTSGTVCFTVRLRHSMKICQPFLRLSIVWG
jgi:hypothetical protein